MAKVHELVKAQTTVTLPGPVTAYWFAGRSCQWVLRRIGCFLAVCLFGAVAGCATGAGDLSTSLKQPEGDGQQQGSVVAPAVERINRFYRAVLYNNVSEIESYLAEGLSPVERHRDNLSAIEVAVKAGHPESVELFLAHGAPPNFASEKGIPLLISALKDGYNSDDYIRRQLKEERSDIPVPRSLEVARVLLAYGADPNAVMPLPDDAQKPALSYAAETGDLAMVRHLVDAGADMNAPKNAYWKPLFLAVRNGHTEVAGWLLNHGADISLRNRSLVFSLVSYAVSGDVETALLLLNKGMSPESFIPSYLMLSEDTLGRDRLVKELIKRGMNVNKFIDGNSALSMAVEQNDLKITKLLLSAGADICYRNYRGDTAYEIATENRYDKIKEYLRRNDGANCSRFGEKEASSVLRLSDLISYEKYAEIVYYYNRSRWIARKLRNEYNKAKKLMYSFLLRPLEPDRDISIDDYEYGSESTLYRALNIERAYRKLKNTNLPSKLYIFFEGEAKYKSSLAVQNVLALYRRLSIREAIYRYCAGLDEPRGTFFDEGGCYQTVKTLQNKERKEAEDKFVVEVIEHLRNRKDESDTALEQFEYTYSILKEMSGLYDSINKQLSLMNKRYLNEGVGSGEPSAGTSGSNPGGQTDSPG